MKPTRFTHLFATGVIALMTAINVAPTQVIQVANAASEEKPAAWYCRPRYYGRSPGQHSTWILVRECPGDVLRCKKRVAIGMSIKYARKHLPVTYRCAQRRY